MASSSSTNNGYDVFLSFRGTDVRNNFIIHLRKALCDNNVKVFVDNNIERGEEITSFLEGIIEGVKISIIVFSSDYASSIYCLDEMVKIIECKETTAQVVLPVFYKVYPSEEIYKEAFARHEQTYKQETTVGRLMSFVLKALHWATFSLTFERYEEIIRKEMKVKRWRSSFKKALGLAGWHIDDNRKEAAVIEEITRDVLRRLNCPSKGEEMICASLVGVKAENNFKKIWECLMNDKISRVGVYGMGGVGKTTIATRINNQLLEVANPFTHIYWLTVSKYSSIYNLQNSIAKKINLNLWKEDNEKRRAAIIQKELSSKKFLLILDDVWEAFEIEDVGIPPLMEGKKLLMTSRSRRVCEIMEFQPIEVTPLFIKDALDLFIQESKYQINELLQWGDIVGSIVKECGGLPLAIVVIARRMRGVKEIWKWRDTFRELQKPCEGENPEIEDKVFKILKFSYDRLPNDKYRQCFLYCSLFPEDHEFYRDELIEYWIVEGLIDEVDSRQAELDKGNVILDELIHASLLETIDVKGFKRIKMHDVIRDMTRMNVKGGLQFEYSFESVEVLEMLKSFTSSTPHCSKLKTLLLRGNDLKELSGCFFVNMQSLNVLHMTWTGVKSIPDCISNLGNLRLLIINACFQLECIPSLAGLENLRHLKISWNESLKEIPKGIERLAKLRVLDLSWNKSLNGSFPSGVLEKFSYLQTLHIRESRVEVEAEALISLEKLETLCVHFHNLQKLNCYVKSGHWRRLLEYQIYYGEQIVENWEKGMCLKIMSLKAIRYVEEWKGEFGMFLPDDIQYLNLVDWDRPMFHFMQNPTFPHLQTISINKYRSKYLFTVELAQHILHKVQKLRIENCDELEEIIQREDECVNSSNYTNYPTILLPNLNTLRLLYLPELRSIYRGRMVCPSLELILIYNCDNLKRLPFCVEKEGNTRNPTIKLGGMISRRWWDSLQWDEPNAKLMFQTILW